MIRICSLLAYCALIAACATGQGYEGAPRAGDEVARITGDLRFTAGAPVTVILRKVGDYELGVNERSIEVLPGKYRVIADCKIAETSSLARFTIETEVYAGEQYRLVAETGPGLEACKGIHLEAVD